MFDVQKKYRITHRIRSILILVLWGVQCVSVWAVFEHGGGSYRGTGRAGWGPASWPTAPPAETPVPPSSGPHAEGPHCCRLLCESLPGEQRGKRGTVFFVKENIGLNSNFSLTLPHSHWALVYFLERVIQNVISKYNAVLGLFSSNGLILIWGKNTLFFKCYNLNKKNSQLE